MSLSKYYEDLLSCNQCKDDVPDYDYCFETQLCATCNLKRQQEFYSE